MTTLEREVVAHHLDALALARWRPLEVFGDAVLADAAAAQPAEEDA